MISGTGFAGDSPSNNSVTVADKVTHEVYALL